MANPQAENGHTDIAHEIEEALMQVNISPYEYRVLWVIIRKTWGWKKKEDVISLSQFEKMTKIKKPNIIRALNKLIKRNIVIKKEPGPIYQFNKDYEQWKDEKGNKLVIQIENDVIQTDNDIIKTDNVIQTDNVIRTDNAVIQTDNAVIRTDNDIIRTDNEVLSELIPSKENNIKETYSKETISKETYSKENNKYIYNNISSNEEMTSMSKNESLSLCKLEKDENSKESKKEKLKIPYDEIIELFNRYCTNFARCRELNSRRRKMIKARWEAYPDMKVWEKVFITANFNEWVIETHPTMEHVLRPANFERYFYLAETPRTFLSGTGIRNLLIGSIWAKQRKKKQQGGDIND